MLGKPVLIKRFVGHVVPFSEAVNELNHPVISNASAARRAVGVASPPGLEPGITA